MKILMLHGYSDSNKGDLAIVVGSIVALKKLYPDAEITLQSVFSADDPEFVFHHRFIRQLGLVVEPMAIPSPYIDSGSHSQGRNLRALFRLSRSWLGERLSLISPLLGRLVSTEAAKAVETMRNSDVVLLKGGQYIYNDQGGIRGLLYLWRMVHPIDVAVRLGKPVVMLGQSVGPLVGDRARHMAASSLERCSGLIVREELSSNLLKDLGLEALSHLSPDMAFLIEPRRPVAGTQEVALLESRGWIGVTVVNWSFPESAKPLEMRTRYLDALVEACEQIYKTHALGIALFPQVTVKHHGESDLDLVERLKVKLEARGVPVLAILGDYWPEEFAYMYGCCQALIGTRLHSCILAACGSTPVVAIRYQGYKTEGVMASLGLSDFVHDIYTVDADNLIKSMDIALARRQEISVQITAKVQEFQNDILGAMKMEIGKALSKSSSVS